MKINIIENKHKQNLETKFFGQLPMLYFVKKQVYKLKQKTKKKSIMFFIYYYYTNILKKKCIKARLWKLSFDINKNEGYKVETIQNSAVYVSKTESY